MTTTEYQPHIHPTAVIDPKADIHPEAKIGPYVVIDGPVKIGRGTRVMAHSYLTGWTEIGEDNTIHMGAVIGHEPQDTDYKGGKTYLKIGHRNIIREHAQIHRGTMLDLDPNLQPHQCFDRYKGAKF